MGTALQLLAGLIFTGSIGLFIYMLFARGRRKKFLGLSVLAFVASFAIAMVGGTLVQGNVLAERGFATVDDMRAADAMGLQMDAEYQAHLEIEKAKAEEETRVAAESKTEEERLAAEELERKEAECRNDLDCWVEIVWIDAAGVCERAVERLAQYKFEWTDDAQEPKFSYYAWADKEKGTISFIGDRIKFQNSSGAWEEYSYMCDYDPATGSVVDVNGWPERL